MKRTLVPVVSGRVGLSLAAPAVEAQNQRGLYSNLHVTFGVFGRF